MASFAQWMQDQMAANPWLGGPAGAGYAGSIGRALDRELAIAKDAAQMGWVAQAPDDAIPLIMGNFNLPIFDGEAVGTVSPPTGMRGRIVHAWETWALAGSPEAIESSLMAWGIPDVHVYEAHELRFLPFNPFLPNADVPWRSCELVILGPDFGTTGIAPAYGPLSGNPNQVGGSTATIQQVRQIVGQILFWKSLHAYPVAVALTWGATILGGINSTGPFTVPVGGGDYSWWDIGKIAGVNQFNGPFNQTRGFWYRDEV